MNNTKKRPGFMLYFTDWDMPRQILNGNSFKLFFDAVFMYALRGEKPKEPFEDKTLQVFFDSFIHKLDADKQHYNNICNKRSEAAKRSHETKASNSMQMPANAANINNNTNNNTNSNTNNNNNYNTNNNNNTNHNTDNNTKQNE